MDFLRSLVAFVLHKVALVSPEDDFNVTQQKMFYIILLAVGVGNCIPYTLFYGLSYGGVFSWDASNSNNTGTLIRCICIAVQACLFIGNFIIFRMRKGHLHPYQTEIVLWVTSFAWQAQSFTGFEYDFRSVLAMIIIFAASVQSKTIWLLCIPTLITYVISVYNSAYFAEGESNWTPTTLHDFRKDSIFEKIFNNLQAMTVAILIIMTIKAQAGVFQKHLEASQVVNQMATEVVSMLSSYDTEGARRAIEKYRSELGEKAVQEGTETGRLVASFERMNDNLDRFKPFLPNYLFLEDHSDRKEDEEDDGEGEVEEMESDDFVGRSSSGRRSRAGKSRRLSNTSQSSSRSRDQRSTADSRSMRSQKHLLTTPGGAISQGNMTDVAFKGKITYASVDFSKLCSAQNTSSSVNHQAPATAPPKILSLFTSMVFNLAKQTKASVHSFLGDRIQLTWNATFRVPMPESKACTFLLKLRSGIEGSMMTKEEEHHQISASASTGSASVYSITTEVTKQQALIIQSPKLLAILKSGCEALASRFNTLVVDEATERVACFHSVLRPIDFLLKSRLPEDQQQQQQQQESPFSYQLALLGGSSKMDSQEQEEPNHSGSSVDKPITTLYELLEVATEQKEDEWMYQLQQTSRNKLSNESTNRDSSNGIYTSILESARRGKYSDSLEMIQGRLVRGPSHFGVEALQITKTEEPRYELPVSHCRAGNPEILQSLGKVILSRSSSKVKV